MNFLCRLGWHSWKPVLRWKMFRWKMQGLLAYALFAQGGAWNEAGHKCRHCGVRK